MLAEALALSALLCGVLIVLALPTLRRAALAPAGPPDIVFVPGGDVEREIAAVRMGSTLSGIRAIIVSSGACDLAELEGCRAPAARRIPILIDRRAVCTLTNFSSVASDLVWARVRHALVVTSEEHANRAFAVARIVFRGHGIGVTCRRVGRRRASEPAWRVVRDAVRAVVSVLLGAGALDSLALALTKGLHPDRARASSEWLAQHGPAQYRLTVPS